MPELSMPFVAGPAINCYNLSTLKILLKRGMTRWVMPVELSGDWLKYYDNKQQNKTFEINLNVRFFLGVTYHLLTQLAALSPVQKIGRKIIASIAVFIIRKGEKGTAVKARTCCA
jgi:hypothetical protein